MNKIKFRSLLPHFVAVIVFLFATLFFCRPALNGDAKLKQIDMVQVDGGSAQLEQYYKEKGYYPNWMTNQFSGMPTYNLLIGGKQTSLDSLSGLVPGYLDSFFQLFLPQPFNFFFLSCICFYIMAMFFGVRPAVAIIGSLGYAFCTYNPVIISVGHITKMLALGYAPALLGSVYYLLTKRSLLGFILSALFATLELKQGHPQISYYLFLIISIMVAVFFIESIVRKKTIELLKPIGLLLCAAIIGISCNAVNLFVVADYAKESKRGGQLVLDESQAKGVKLENGRTTGLDVDYAFLWSSGIFETLSMIVPGAVGYGSPVLYKDQMYPMLGENSAVNKYLVDDIGANSEQASNFTNNLSGKLYWGKQPFTSGPFYTGAMVFSLFLLGLFFVNKRELSWIILAAIFGVMLSWGKNFGFLNNFLFEYLPYYKNLRAPSMSLVMVELLFPLGAVLGIEKLLSTETSESKDKLKKGFLTLAGFSIFLLTLWAFSDFSNENKAFTAAMKQVDSKTISEEKYKEIAAKFPPGSDNNLKMELAQVFQGDEAKANKMISALRSDRSKIFLNDTILVLVFFGVAALIFWALQRRFFHQGVLLGLLSLMVFADLYFVGVKYFNENNFEEKEAYVENNFKIQPTDQLILKDKDPNFRVFNLASGDPFQETGTSYFHKSIGGYHPMKLGIYDDLYTYQLSGKLNINVLNMLNVKYVIQKAETANSAPVIVPNSNALGNAWFAKHIKFVPDARAEMIALNNLNTRDSAVAQESYKSILQFVTASDTSDRIKQVSFDNDEIVYESETKGNKLAIFSEIFYKDWNAYIDGIKAPIAKVNYVLRGLKISEGKHKIEFKFEPKIVRQSRNVAAFGNIVLLLSVLLGAFLLLKGFKKKDEA